MAWGLNTIFGSSPSEPTPVRQKSSDGGYVAPDRNTREVCYESRDLFFECLDKNDILDAVRNDEDAKRKCGKEMGEFERDCARSWVSRALLVLRLSFAVGKGSAGRRAIGSREMRTKRRN